MGTHRAHDRCEQWRRAWLRAASRLAGLTWPLPDGLDDEGLELLLFPAPAAASQSERRPALRVSRDREHGFHRIVSKYFAGS